MKTGGRNPDKELYKQLRGLSCEQLWQEEVRRFDQAAREEKIERVAVIRAVGVVFSESGTREQKDAARFWLLNLLHDPDEKIRRYAMAALPKIGAGPNEEEELLSLLRRTVVEREKKFLAQTLEKFGGAATLKELGNTSDGLHLQTEQKVKAALARDENPSVIRMDRVFSIFDGLRIHLRGRRGLEEIVREEMEDYIRRRRKFRVSNLRDGLVAITPIAPFTLGDIYSLRCFGTVGFAVGAADSLKGVASVIASPLSRRVLETFTEGPIRYRLEFVSKGHQRGAVRLLANQVYALCPELLNSAHNAPWAISIHSTATGNAVELSPKLIPDPRFFYRQKDVPAASHPPLAACMARIAGRGKDEIVWDPFCGSGLELIERALLGGVRRIFGTDRSAEAITITERNFAAANLKAIQSTFVCSDFRDFAKIEGLGPNSVSLIISNPPMGKRVHIANLRGLIEDLFAVAAITLRAGGRLVFANPLRMERPHRLLKLQSRRVIDFGGFDCFLEEYLKVAPGSSNRAIRATSRNDPR